MVFTLPDLPYDYNALEPHYNEETLRVHHGKHHQTYTDKLNAAAKTAGVAGQAIEDILTSLNSIADDKRTAVINNGGGYYNHTFFWESMAPNGGSAPEGALSDAITGAFGSFKAFQETFSTKAATHFGSGWAWLVVNSQDKLEVTTTHDQVCPLSLGQTPLLTIDVWEHTYYLQYKNVRPDWIKAFWSVVNWDKVAARFKTSPRKVVN